MNADVRARLERLLGAARRLAEPGDPTAAAAREAIAASSGLSLAGVELALAHCLETQPSEQELESLCASVRPARRAHVLLSANLFVATNRAIALGLACSALPAVRPSRREPTTARFLAEAAPGLFELTDTLRPAPGDELFAYGTDATLSEVTRTLGAGAHVNAYGEGFGLVALEASALEDANTLPELAELLALDIVLFDQRGCLSPRLFLVEGERAAALALAEALSSALAAWESRVPRGRLALDELGALRHYRDSLTYAGDLFQTRGGSVGVAPADTALNPAPSGRVAHLVPVRDAERVIRALAPALTTLSARGSSRFEQRSLAAAPHARPARPGTMQRPAFDGPVDRRPARPTY